MSSIKELNAAWKDAGKPSDLQGIMQVLSDQGLTKKQVKQSMEMAKVMLPPSIVIPSAQVSDNEPDTTEPDTAEDLSIPAYRRKNTKFEPHTGLQKGVKATSKKGTKYTYDGDQWVVDATGKPANKGTQRMISRGFINKSNNKARPMGVDSEGNQSIPSVEPQPEEPISAEIQSIANKITNSGDVVKIKKLLVQDHPIADLAVDLIMNGHRDEALKLLTSKSQR